MVSTKQKEPSSVVEGRKTMLPGILRFRKKQQTSPAPTSDLQKQKAEEPKSNIVNRSFNKRQRRDKKSEKVAEDQKTLATTPGRGGICDFSNLFDFYFDWNDSRQIKIETQTTTVTLEVRIDNTNEPRMGK